MCPGISAALAADGFLISLKNFTKICALHFAIIIERERDREMFLFLSEQVSAKTDWPSELVLMSFAFAVKCHLHLGHVMNEASVFFLKFCRVDRSGNS